MKNNLFLIPTFSILLLVPSVHLQLDTEVSVLSNFDLMSKLDLMMDPLPVDLDIFSRIVCDFEGITKKEKKKKKKKKKKKEKKKKKKKKKKEKKKEKKKKKKEE